MTHEALEEEHKGKVSGVLGYLVSAVKSREYKEVENDVKNS